MHPQTTEKNNPQPKTKLRKSIKVSFAQAATVKIEQSFKEDLEDEELMRNLNKKVILGDNLITDFEKLMKTSVMKEKLEQNCTKIIKT